MRGTLAWAVLIALGGTAPGLCIPLQPPAAHDGSPGNQDEPGGSGKQQRDPGVSIVQPAQPGRAPEAGDEGQRDAGQGDRDGADDDWQKVTGWITAGAALASLAVSCALLFVGKATLRVYQRQAEIMETQAQIMRETREIAHAALDRPYVLIETASYRYEEGGENLILYFDFKVRNYGDGPAIVRHVVALGFLSSGRHSAREDDYRAIPFPRPDELPRLLGDRPSVRVFPEVNPGILSTRPLTQGFRHKSTLILRTGETGPEFTHLAKDVFLRKSDKLPEWTQPYLIGIVTYSDVFGKRHQTRFCFRGRSDGVAEEYGEPPYNERT